jgi:hypothetical protein
MRESATDAHIDHPWPTRGDRREALQIDTGIILAAPERRFAGLGDGA